MPAGARGTLRNAGNSNYYKVAIDGYEGGSFSLLAPF
jgi:hypothetical protein